MYSLSTMPIAWWRCGSSADSTPSTWRDWDIPGDSVVELSPQEQAFAAEVARSRARAGVTQDWLARTIGLSRPKVSEMCAGHFLPGREVLDALITALTMDHDGTVERWTAACEGRRQRRRQEKLTRLPPPAEGWSVLPALGKEITSLLRAQVQAAQPLPYRLPGAREPSLATVYVRQHLGSAAEDAQPEVVRREVVLDGRGDPIEVPAAPSIRLAVRPLARTVSEILNSDDHLLVTGGPGQGKSTLSLRLAAEIAECWTSPPEKPPLTEPVIPCRLTARELAARLGQPFPQALAETASAEYGALLSSPIPPASFERRVAGCRWLLLVDGVDEVADIRQRDRLVTVLAALSGNANSPFRIALTTRPVEGTTLAPLLRIGAASYELLPFDEDALRRFADTWFAEVGDDTAHRFVAQIREAYLDELVRVPLLATIAAIIFEQHEDRPLPDNQYELYEGYLRYLRNARIGPASRFDSRRDELLEYLGRVRLETDASLAAAAQTWATSNFDATLLIGEWQAELAAFLVTVGPLVLRGGDLQFLHHSFAEHLAATAQARLLPPQFDPQHDAFRRVLHASRPSKRGRFARSVLIHFARLRPAEGARIISWLHNGGAEEHLLAARLLARRVPADEAVVEAFLSTVRGWARTSQHPGAEILEQTSRAAHHPGLSAWLLDLMSDKDAPWRSRTEAAIALATRLRGPHTADALDHLRALVDNSAAVVDQRLAAAEALSQCARGERAVAERGLRAVLADPAASGRASRNAAVVLAGFGAQTRFHAVTALSALLADPWTPLSDLTEAAAGLAEISVAHHEQCADAFRVVLRARPRTSRFKDAAAGLAALGAEHVEEAVSLLDRTITDRRLDWVERVRVADALAELGPQHRAAAGRYLIGFLDEPGITPDNRVLIAESLIDCGGSFREAARAILRATLHAPSASANTLLSAARSWIDLEHGHRDVAADALQAVVDQGAVGELVRTTALGHLARLGEPYRAPAVAALRADLNSRSEDPETRCAAADELIRLGPEFHADTAASLLGISQEHADVGTRIRVWPRLLQVDSRHRDRATVVIAGLLASDELAVWEPVAVEGQLVRIRVQELPTVVAAVTAAASDQGPMPRSVS